MVEVFMRAGVPVLLTGVMTAGLLAQAPGGPLLRGNPTPGTPQPDPPKLADRITLTGCVQTANSKPKSQTPEEANTPSDSRYILTNAKRETRVPLGAGTSNVATTPISPTYRLAAIDSALSPFVNTRVEISGAVEPPSDAAEGPNAKAPALRVEFVQKLAPSCSQ